MTDVPIMGTWRDVPIPEMLNRRPTDKRGYPIPWIVTIDEVGTPLFTINHEVRRQEAIRRGLCSLCGVKLFALRAFVGGPESAFNPLGAYLDPPMHIKCAQYALQVCPFLAAPKYLKRIEDKLVDYDQLPGVVIAVDQGAVVDRPPVFVMVVSNTTRKLAYHGRVEYTKPGKPHQRIEFWLHGKKLTDLDGLVICREAGVDLHSVYGS